MALFRVNLKSPRAMSRGDFAEGEGDLLRERCGLAPNSSRIVSYESMTALQCLSTLYKSSEAFLKTSITICISFLDLFCSNVSSVLRLGDAYKLGPFSMFELIRPPFSTLIL